MGQNLGCHRPYLWSDHRFIPLGISPLQPPRNRLGSTTVSQNSRSDPDDNVDGERTSAIGRSRSSDPHGDSNPDPDPARRRERSQEREQGCEEAEYARPGPSPITGILSGFRDGLGLAMRLADEYACIGAAVLLDRSGNILDVITADGIGRPVGPLIGRVCAALDRPERQPRPCAEDLSDLSDSATAAVSTVVLLTVRPFDADVIREADLRLFRRARWAIGVAGAELRDWIETDGDLFRSYAYITCPALAWPDDPPGERLDRAWSA